MSGLLLLLLLHQDRTYCLTVNIYIRRPSPWVFGKSSTGTDTSFSSVFGGASGSYCVRVSKRLCKPFSAFLLSRAAMQQKVSTNCWLHCTKGGSNINKLRSSVILKLGQFQDYGQRVWIWTVVIYVQEIQSFQWKHCVSSDFAWQLINEVDITMKTCDRDICLHFLDI